MFSVVSVYLSTRFSVRSMKSIHPLTLECSDLYSKNHHLSRHSARLTTNQDASYTPSTKRTQLYSIEEAQVYRCLQIEKGDLVIKYTNIPSQADPNDQVNRTKPPEIVNTRFGFLVDNGISIWKTIMILIETGRNKADKSFNEISLPDNSFTISRPVSYGHTSNTNLILVPNYLFKQWQDNLRPWLTVLNIRTIDDKRQLDQFVNISDHWNIYDVILMSFPMYQKYTKSRPIAHVCVNRIFVDAAENFMNTPILDSNMYWIVASNTTNSLEPNEYRSNSFIRQYCTKIQGFSPLNKCIVVRGRDSFVQASYQLPDTIRNIVECQMAQISSKSSIIHCLNTHNIKGLLAILGVNTATQFQSEENLVRLFVQESGPAFHHERIHNIRQRICVNDTCSICFSDILNKTVLGCCQNIYCFKCINQWLVQKSSCPMCKSNINVRKDMFIVEKEGTQEIQGSSSMLEQTRPLLDLGRAYDKMENLRRIFQNIDLKNNAQVLIYTRRIDDEHKAKVMQYMESENIKYARVCGSINVMNKTITDFQSGCIRALMIDITNCPFGLDLHHTTDIIFVHKPDAVLRTKIITLAQRPGRKEALRIWDFA